MPDFDLASLAAGVLAYGVAVGLAVVLVFGLFRFHAKVLVNRRDEEDMLLAGHRSLAIALGASLLSQAVCGVMIQFFRPTSG